MRKLLVFVVMVLFFASCGTRRTDEGVVINGVRWATNNVDVPGTFAKNPEDVGMFFQWNRRRGWATRGETITWGNSMMRTGEIWTRRNDPCPRGWRMPTREELASLNNAGSEWTTKNGVNGRLFGSKCNQIFLPVSGLGTTGVYWSSTPMGTTTAWYLYLNRNNSGMGALTRNHRFNVRCVAK